MEITKWRFLLKDFQEKKNMKLFLTCKKSQKCLFENFEIVFVKTSMKILKRFKNLLNHHCSHFWQFVKFFITLTLKVSKIMFEKVFWLFFKIKFVYNFFESNNLIFENFSDSDDIETDPESHPIHFQVRI